MSWKGRITNKTIVLTSVLGSLLVIAMIMANALRSSRKISVATDEAVAAVSSFYLEEMADRRAQTITNLIANNFDEMDKAVEFIASENPSSQDELRDGIGQVKSLLGLSRFALVDKDNIVYTQYTTYTGGSRHEFLADDQLDGRIISTVSLYGSSKQLCLAIPTPDLRLMGKQFKACFVQLDINDIVNLLAFDSHGKTHFALYLNNGGNVSGTELGPVISNHNFYSALEGIVSEDVYRKHCDNFANEKPGSLTFTVNGAEETLWYVPIEDTGWVLAVLIRESVIQEQIHDISERTLATNRDQIIFALVAVLALAAILLIQLRIMTKERIEQEKEASRTFRTMASTDALTGVRNKHAYTENEAVLNKQIQAGELQKLAVVVGDINGLKIVNDTQGHAAGDQLIKDACALICDHFTHGAVFRIGGDEFAVILQGKGYDTMHDVVDELNRKVEDNIGKDDVVVSIGYAELSQDDRRLRDVFERADQMMYERKKQLKAMGAPTSRL